MGKEKGRGKMSRMGKKRGGRREGEVEGRRGLTGLVLSCLPLVHLENSDQVPNPHFSSAKIVQKSASAKKRENNNQPLKNSATITISL